MRVHTSYTIIKGFSLLVPAQAKRGVEELDDNAVIFLILPSNDRKKDFPVETSLKAIKLLMGYAKRLPEHKTNPLLIWGIGPKQSLQK